MKVRVSSRLKILKDSNPSPTFQERVSVRMDHVDENGVTRIETGANGVALEERRGRVEAGDTADVLDFATRKASDMCTQRESN